ncbi:MAG: hypothetical protein ACI9EK_002837 [Psychroserpens sp.]|jgi:hypothetical protein
MKIIKLKNLGFDALADLYNINISREESVHQLIDTLGEIEEVKELSAYKALNKHSGLNDVAGIVTNLNAELEIKGFIIVI